MERMTCILKRYILIFILLFPLNVLAQMLADTSDPLPPVPYRNTANPSDVVDKTDINNGFNSWLDKSLAGENPAVVRHVPSNDSIDEATETGEGQNVAGGIESQWQAVKNWVSDTFGSDPNQQAQEKYDAQELPKTVDELEALLPKLEKNPGTQPKDIKKNLQQFNQAPLFSSSQPEAQPIRQLASQSSKKINISTDPLPLLNIEEEAEISSSLAEFDLGSIALINEQKTQALPTPPQRSLKTIKENLAKVGAPRDIKKDEAQWRQGLTDEIVRHEAINKIDWLSADTLNDPSVKPYAPMTPGQLKFLEAAIVERKYDGCHVSLGLYKDLLKDKSVKQDAQLELGLCKFKLGLYTDALDLLLPLMSNKRPEVTKRIVGTLMAKLPSEHEMAVANKLRHINTSLIPTQARNKAYYLLAKSALLDGHRMRAQKYAQKVTKNNSNLRARAQLTLALAQYSKQPQKALKTLQRLEKFVRARGINDRDVKSLMHVNLARIYFNQDHPKKAFHHFQKVDKNHPLWVQAMIEMGWTQIALGDYSGAIGNMYSMHSPYFKMIYKPQTYSVRAVGYLGICQYGDAYRSITHLERTYRDWLKALKSYEQSNSKTTSYYATVLEYLKGKSSNSVDGLSPQLLREMGRQKDFLHYQTAINRSIDEKDEYGQIDQRIGKEISKLVWRMKKAQERLSDVTQKIAKAKSNKSMKKSLNQWQAQKRHEEKVLARNRLEKELLEKGRKHFKEDTKVAQGEIQKQIASYKQKAGSALKGHVAKIEKEMSMVLENNEFLRYEIFAGAGENLRYQTAGGNTTKTKRIPDHIKPKKIVKWSFDGEYWEDEIGNYRSSLKNNCPTYSQASAN